jgi:uncharacterized protein (TIGR02147 family)
MKGMDLIDILNIEFESRRAKNPKYSLRAFARDLEVQPATMSHFLKRKRVPSPAFRERAYVMLNLSVDQRRQLENGADEIFRFSEMDMDIFVSLSNWYYDAILELLRTKGIKSQEGFVAKRLGISVAEAESAINRLMQMGMIKQMPNKTWVVNNENTLTYGGDQTNFALQNLQRQLMEKAIIALQEVPKKNREQASMTMAVNKNDLPEVKQRIKKFQQELCEFLQRPNRDADEVYQLVTSFFPLTVLKD